MYTRVQLYDRHTYGRSGRTQPQEAGLVRPATATQQEAMGLSDVGGVLVRLSCLAYE